MFFSLFYRTDPHKLPNEAVFLKKGFLLLGIAGWDMIKCLKDRPNLLENILEKKQ
jgi:hypothetical protein